MPVSAVFRSSGVPVVWAHAVNSLAKLRAVTAQLLSASEESPIGLEVDVRVAPHDAAMVPVLHHDLISEKDAVTCVTLAAWLQELAAVVQGVSARIGVVKLDFKDVPAAVMSHQLLAAQPTLYETLSTCFAFWWNADIVAAGPEEIAKATTNTASFSFISQGETQAIIRAAVHQLGVGLSFGWRLPDEFRAYTVPDVIRMREFLHQLVGCDDREEKGDDATRNSDRRGNDDCSGRAEMWRVPPACVTFALRCSAVLEAQTREQREILWQSLDDLLDAARSLFTVAGAAPVCFLSFWRGRNERITDEQIALARTRFPTCTIDVD